MAYLIGFDEDFATSAQVHIWDRAKHKREKRIANRAAQRMRQQAMWENMTDAERKEERERKKRERQKRERKKRESRS